MKIAISLHPFHEGFSTYKPHTKSKPIKIPNSFPKEPWKIAKSTVLCQTACNQNCIFRNAFIRHSNQLQNRQSNEKYIIPNLEAWKVFYCAVARVAFNSLIAEHNDIHQRWNIYWMPTGHAIIINRFLLLLSLFAKPFDCCCRWDWDFWFHIYG